MHDTAPILVAQGCEFLPIPAAAQEHVTADAYPRGEANQLGITHQTSVYARIATQKLTNSTKDPLKINRRQKQKELNRMANETHQQG